MDNGVGVAFEHMFHVLLDRDTLEDPADHVEHLVGVEFLADDLQLLQQCLEDAAFAGRGRDEIQNHDGVVFLPVAMDATHPLFQTRWIPGDIPVHHEPAELQVNTLTCGVGGDQESATAFVVVGSEPLDLHLALGVVHAAMNLGNVPSVAHAFQPADQVGERVAVLGKDDELLAGELRIEEDALEALELRLRAGRVVDLLSQVAELPHLFSLTDEVGKRRCNDALEHLVLGDLVGLLPVFGPLFVGGRGLEDVVFLRHPLLVRQQLLHRDSAGLHVGDDAVELVEPPLE